MSYDKASTLLGPLQPGSKVSYRRVFSRRQNVALYTIIAFNIVTGGLFLAWLLMPSHLPAGGSAFTVVAGVTATVLMVGLELIRLMQAGTLALFAAKAKDPVPLVPEKSHRVAILTTIVPGSEPLGLVMSTLRKMKKIRHKGHVGVSLLDEGNSPEVAAACAEAGVNHFSRKGIPEYNQPSGPYKAKTKHGNHNAWRHAHEADYDLVAQMDPDHVPFPNFLERTVGYFNDPDVAYVVAPQVYGNLFTNWIAKGSAFLAYVFHGIIQRGGNGLGAPLLIGTNHVYRVSAFKQIGGYQDSIIEDHLTAMEMLGAVNPDTGNRWRGVYTPDILSVGEGPMSSTDFFNQQKRWAYGIWEIIQKHSLRKLRRLRPAQAISFMMLQQFYPSVAVSWIMSLVLTGLYLFSDAYSRLPVEQWGILWGTSLASTIGLFLWLRRFNLVEHERRDWGLVGMGLMLMTIPIYVAAAARKVAGLKFAYVVTNKGELQSKDSVRPFAQHLLWAAIAGLMLIASLTGLGSTFAGHRFWLSWTLAICLVPVGIHYYRQLAQYVQTTVARMRAQAQHVPQRADWSWELPGTESPWRWEPYPHAINQQAGLQQLEPAFAHAEASRN
ncbi:MAG: glycosyltransferase family 2 [Candidatus Saccharibacteria bacterium]|jgi:hypothetical protein|nr:glycosyltransferase family 2 [Candidatus Saccharibacteria bacterium]